MGYGVNRNPQTSSFFCEQLSRIELLNIFLENLLWLYLTLNHMAIVLKRFFAISGVCIVAKNGPKMGHLTANNGSFPQQPTTRVGVVTT